MVYQRSRTSIAAVSIFTAEHLKSTLFFFSEAGVPLPDNAPSFSEIDNPNLEYSPFDKLVIQLLENFAYLLEWYYEYIFKLEYDELFHIQSDLEYMAIGIASIYIKPYFYEVVEDVKVFDNYLSKSEKEAKGVVVSTGKLMRFQFFSNVLAIEKSMGGEEG